MTWIVFLVSVVLSISAERSNFDGCEVWMVTPTNLAQLQQLQALSKLHESQEDGQITFWEAPRRTIHKSEILVCDEGIHELRNFLRKTGIAGELVSSNLQRNLEDVFARKEARHTGGIANYTEDDYNTYEDIISQLDVLQGNCPEVLTCTVETIGMSTEGRPLVIFRIEKQEENRRAIYFDSLIHAREWLAGATLMGILTKLVNEYGTDPEATRLIDSYDFNIVPVVNPDGYTFTWSDVSNRFWRKSRIVNEGSDCLGTDLNRNFDFAWGETGSSSDPCSITYHGASPASDPETRIIQSTVEELRGRLVLFLTYHTTAELYLFPFGFLDEDQNCRRSPDHEDINRAGQATVKAIQETFNVGNWVSGTSCETLGTVSGTSRDWVYGVGIVKYTYTPELRGPGFDPDRSNIIPSIEENWNGLIALVNEIEDIEGF